MKKLAFCPFKVLFISFLVFSISPLSAQKVDSLQLQEVTVFGSQLDLQPEQTGRNTTVIPGRQISELPVNSFDELLWYLPSLEVQARGGFGSQSDISLRGSTFNQVLILIDGMRVNDPLTGHFNGYLPVAPGEIYQIEIIRGPASAIYGPDAVGGVINIVTYAFAAPDTGSATGIELGLTAGEYDFVSGQSGFHLRKGKFHLSGGTLLNQSNGQRLPEDTLRSEFNLQTYSLGASFKPNEKWQFSARGGWDYRDFNAVYYYTRSTFDRSRETVRRGWAQGTARFRPNKSMQTLLQASYQWNQDSFLFNPAFTGNNHTSQLISSRLTQRVRVMDNLEIQLGAEANQRTIESNDRGNHDTFHWGSFLQGHYTPIAGISVVPAIRVDQDDAYGLEFSPQVNLSWNRPKIVYRAAAGRAIRAADFTERFVSNNLPGPLPSNRNYGNPDLEAERSWSGELGADITLLPWLTLKSTGFYRQSTDLIDFALTPASAIPNGDNLDPDGEYFYTTNLSELATYGMENELWIQKKIGDLKLQSVVGYSRIITDEQKDVNSKYVANHAGHAISGNLTIGYKNAGLSLTGRYKNRDSDDAEAINRELKTDYHVWNLKVSYQVWKQFQVHATVLNLLDEQYSDILGASMPRRWSMGGITWRLN